MMLIFYYFLLNVFLFFVTILFYFFRKKETDELVIKEINKFTILKLSIFFLTILSITLFGLNLPLIMREPDSFLDSFLITVSIILLIYSNIIFKMYFGVLKLNFLKKLFYPSVNKSKNGTITLGKVIYKDKIKHPFFLSLDDLAQHMFVCGSTGSGKSTFMQNFLLNFSKKHNNISFLIAEFKGEYQFLQKKIEDLLIIKPGENFNINIFDPEGSDAEVHAERVFQFFNSTGFLEGTEYSPQMERCFIEVLKEICPDSKKRSWEAFFEITAARMRKTSDQTIKKSFIAIENRIRRYSLGTLKNIFVKKSGLNVKELFDHKILLDLSSIIRLGGEKEDALFFLNMILKYLWDKRLESGSRDYNGIKHITIIEDAQYFAPEEFSNRTKLTSYIEDIALLLRGTGECLISLATRPEISREILANCGVLVCFKTHIQKALMQELLNLEDYQKEYLSMLQKGQCIVRVNSLEKPFLIQIPLVQRSWLTKEEIKEGNQKIIDSKTNEINIDLDKKEEKLKQICEENVACKSCGGILGLDSEYCDACVIELKKENKEFEGLREFLKSLTEN